MLETTYVSRNFRWFQSFSLLLLGAGCGYGVRVEQDVVRTRIAMSVDSSWVGKARSCWKGLSSWTDEEIRSKLGHPPQFRSAFPFYLTSTDQRISEIAMKPSTNSISIIKPANAGPWEKYEKPNGNHVKDEDPNDPYASLPDVGSNTSKDPFAEFQKPLPSSKQKPDWFAENAPKYEMSPADSCSLSDGVPSEFGAHEPKV